MSDTYENTDEGTDHEELEGPVETEKFIEYVNKIQSELKDSSRHLTIQEDEIFGKEYTINFKSGDTTRPIFINDEYDAKVLSRASLKEIEFLKDYIGYFSTERSSVAAAVSLIGGPQNIVQARLRSILRALQSENDKGLSFVLKSFDKCCDIVLRYPTGVQPVLLQAANPCLRLSVRGYHIRSGKEAKRILETVAHALFLQIEAKTGVALSLVSGRQATSGSRPSQRIARRHEYTYEFPKTSPRTDAFQLYWYALGAYQMPVMQYIAFYQTIETFFEIYTDAEARQILRQNLLRPDFEVSNDHDLGQLISRLRSVVARPSERTQLKHTLLATVDQENLRQFLKKNDNINKFLSDDKTLGVKKIKSDSQDLLEEICERVYQIRCAIVHTKGVGIENVPSILPQSEQEKFLTADLQVVRFLARNVLGASSQTISLSKVQ
jgi:hypothetical protein